METKPPPYKVRCIPCNKSIDSATPETICPRCKRNLSCHINPLGIQHDSRIMKPDPKPKVNPQVNVNPKPDGNPKNIVYTIFFAILIIKFFPMIPAVIIAIAIIIGVPLLLIVLPLLFLVYAASMANDVANIAKIISKHKNR